MRGHCALYRDAQAARVRPPRNNEPVTETRQECGVSWHAFVTGSGAPVRTRRTGQMIIAVALSPRGAAQVRVFARKVQIQGRPYIVLSSRSAPIGMTAPSLPDAASDVFHMVRRTPRRGFCNPACGPIARLLKKSRLTGPALCCLPFRPPPAACRRSARDASPLPCWPPGDGTRARRPGLTWRQPMCRPRPWRHSVRLPRLRLTRWQR